MISVDRYCVKKPIDRLANRRECGHGPREILLRGEVSGFGDGRFERGVEVLFLILLEKGHIGGAGIPRAVFLLLGFEDVGGPLVAGQQIRPVIGGEEGAKRLHPLDDQNQVIFAKGEHRIHKVMAVAFIAEMDFQAVGEKGEEVGGFVITSGTTSPIII